MNRSTDSMLSRDDETLSDDSLTHTTCFIISLLLCFLFAEYKYMYKKAVRIPTSQHELTELEAIQLTGLDDHRHHMPPEIQLLQVVNAQRELADLMRGDSDPMPDDLPPMDMLHAIHAEHSRAPSGVSVVTIESCKAAADETNRIV